MPEGRQASSQALRKLHNCLRKKTPTTMKCLEFSKQNPDHEKKRERNK